MSEQLSFVIGAEELLAKQQEKLSLKAEQQPQAKTTRTSRRQGIVDAFIKARRDPLAAMSGPR